MFFIVLNSLLVIHVIVSLLIILVVLMQRPKSEGLGAAFGGGMTENLFGAQTTNVLATFTRWLGGIFFALTLLLSVLYAKQSTTKSAIQRELILNAKPVPSATPQAEPSATPAPSAASEPVTAPSPESKPASSAPEAAPSVVKPSPAAASKSDKP